MEVWKDIVGYEGLYKVSSFGNIMATYKPKNQHQMNRILKFNVIKGYHHVQLHNKNSVKSVRVHRMVAMAFLTNPENKPAVNHLNGIKSDNKIVNLQWCTHSENEKHSYSVLGKTPHNKK